ncbi:sigma factor-like helix-turn-helix DNA-binding protein [Streptomyces sp. NPDC057638]|uniref:sigma factor-like helix-turn-helix DNA-binding protein n=1 Tax=Streptomyces sp. NPDC057638 TaxID=3346190 RepID=UPI0036B69709
MSERRPGERHRRAREFEEFVAGAAGRLLHAATLLTGEPPAANPAARALVTDSLAHTYAAWDRPRGGDPYDHARRELALRFLRAARRHRRDRGGLLGRLTPRERLVLVLRLSEGVAEEQTGALLDLRTERVRDICGRAVATLCPPLPPLPEAGTATESRTVPEATAAPWAISTTAAS